MYKISEYKNFLLQVFLILSFVALFNSLQIHYSLPIDDSTKQSLIKIFISKAIYFWYFVLPAYVIFQIQKRVHLTYKNGIRWLAIHFSVMFVSFIVHEIIFICTNYLIWNMPAPNSLLMFFNNPRIWIEALVYVALLLSIYLIEYKKDSYENEIKCSYLEAQLVKSKMKELRNKLRPNFLLHTLQTIRYLVREGKNQDANSILSLLSDFLRTTIYDAEKEEITINEEINYLKQYLAIEAFRNQREIKYEFHTDDIVLNASIPNFLLQPIVEEIIYYSDSVKSVLNKISVWVKKNENMLELIISFHFKKKFTLHSGLTKDLPILEATRARLNLIYKEKSTLNVDIKADDIIEIIIIIPYYGKEIVSERMLVLESVK